MSRRPLPVQLLVPVVLLFMPACEPPAPTRLADCTGQPPEPRDPCLSNLAVALMATDPDAGIAALNEIKDPVARLAAGGAIFASRDMVFDYYTSKKICAALHDSFDEGFCERRLGQGHLRGQ
ncbi:MAG: hypothetical protein EXR69_07140 [Myxococcales bacterium]|nr:hypothetical protein [Myxococcales bacterium]